MLSGMVKELTGGYKVTYHANGYNDDLIKIDFTPPFRRNYLIEELEKMANLSIPKYLSSDEAKKYFADACTKLDISCPPPQTTAVILVVSNIMLSWVTNQNGWIFFTGLG